VCAQIVPGCGRSPTALAVVHAQEDVPAAANCTARSTCRAPYAGRVAGDGSGAGKGAVNTLEQLEAWSSPAAPAAGRTVSNAA
jgi:hypothetical protein